MKTIVVTRTMAASAEQVFDRLTDLDNYASFPGVRRTRLVRKGSPACNGVGAIREVDARVFWLQEEILRFERPWRMDYRIRRSRPVIHHKAGSMRLESTASGTKVSWSSTFAMPRPLGFLEPAAAKLSEWMFVRILRHVESQLRN